MCNAIRLTGAKNNRKRYEWRVWKTYPVQYHQADTVSENPQDDGGGGGTNK